jgi:hypothetical protein
MYRAQLWIVTAVLEAGTGLALLGVPAVPLVLLLGATQAAPDTVFVSRVAGAALLAIGVACWLARGDRGSPAGFGLLIGVLVYDAAATGLLVYAAVFLAMAGVALWPAVVVHAALGVWCVVCLWVRPRDGAPGKDASP